MTGQYVKSGKTLAVAGFRSADTLASSAISWASTRELTTTFEPPNMTGCRASSHNAEYPATHRPDVPARV